MTATVQATKQLAEFAADTTFESLSPKVREMMPMLMIDIFRAAAVGRPKAWSVDTLRAFEGLGSKETSSIFYENKKLDAQRAAYVNGTYAGSLDWDDSHAGALIHPGVVIWPAALAAAEMTNADGKALLTAVSAGYEVAIRIGMSIQLSHSLRGFHGTTTCGTFGAATACAKLFGFDAKRMNSTLGLAASYASGLSQFFVSGSDIKRIHAGKAAAQGVEVALLAKADLTGPHDVIEGAQGFGQAVSDAFNVDVIVEDIGETFHTEGVLLKVHAGTARLQAAVEAAEIIARRGVDPSNIEKVEVGVHPAAMGKLSWNEPVDTQQAQLSAPFAVAMSLTLTGQRDAPLILGLDDFDTCVKDPAIRALSARTVCVIDDEIAGATTREVVPARVVAYLKDGSTEEAKVMVPKGSGNNPMPMDDVVSRYRMTVSELMSEKQTDAWLEKAMNLTVLKATSDLFAVA